MTRWTRNRRIAAVGIGTIVASALTIGSAAAFFGGHGTGTGTATAGVGVFVTTTATTPVGAMLYPGGAAVPISLTIVRPGTTNVRITDLSLRTGVSVTADATHAAAGCTGLDGIVTVATKTGLSLNVTSATLTTSVPATVSMTTAAPNACQGATFTIPVNLSGVAL